MSIREISKMKEKSLVKSEVENSRSILKTVQKAIGILSVIGMSLLIFAKIDFPCSQNPLSLSTWTFSNLRCHDNFQKIKLASAIGGVTAVGLAGIVGTSYLSYLAIKNIVTSLHNKISN